MSGGRRARDDWLIACRSIQIFQHGCYKRVNPHAVCSGPLCTTLMLCHDPAVVRKPARTGPSVLAWPRATRRLPSIAVAATSSPRHVEAHPEQEVQSPDRAVDWGLSRNHQAARGHDNRPQSTLSSANDHDNFFMPAPPAPKAKYPRHRRTDCGSRTSFGPLPPQGCGVLGPGPWANLLSSQTAAITQMEVALAGKSTGRREIGKATTRPKASLPP